MVIEAARAGAASSLPSVDVPPGAMNSPALLHEIGAQMRELRAPGAPAHVVNLTLFPMTPEDHAVLGSALPVGTVAIISRGFGNCRITSTGARDVWRVQYFNQMNTLILNTIEVVVVPEVALAATEDLEDTPRAARRAGRVDERILSGLTHGAEAAADVRGIWRCRRGRRRPPDGMQGLLVRVRPGRGRQRLADPAGTPFAALPPHWTCPNCSATKDQFLVLADD